MPSLMRIEPCWTEFAASKGIWWLKIWPFFNQQRLKLHGKELDLSEIVAKMQQQTRLWGGWDSSQYKKVRFVKTQLLGFP